MSSPTARTLTTLRQAGYLAAPVERFIAHANIRRDLFGAFDVLAVHSRRKEFLFVQCTSLAHVGDRLAKVRAAPAVPPLLAAGAAVEVWGWDGRRLKRVSVQPGDLDGVVLVAPPRRHGGRGGRQGFLF